MKKAETVIKEFNRVYGILVDLTMKEMTNANYSNLVDFYEKYHDSDFASLFEDELKNSVTDIGRLFRIVSAICQSSQNEIYKKRTDEFKKDLERIFERAKKDAEYENKRYQEYNKKYDSIIRDYYDPENAVFKRYWSDFNKAREQERKAKGDLEKCDTAISNIFLLCTKVRELILPYCQIEDLSIANGITINNAHYNISSEQRINQQITNIHTEQKDNQLTDKNITSNNIDNSVTNNNYNNAYRRNNSSNSPIDVSSQNNNEDYTYFDIDFAKRIYPLVSGFHDLNETATNLVPNNILNCRDYVVFFDMLNFRITGDYKQYRNASKNIIKAFIYVLKDCIKEIKYRDKWEKLMYINFYGNKEHQKIHEDIRKHKDQEYANELKAALKKV